MNRGDKYNINLASLANIKEEQSSPMNNAINERKSKTQSYNK